MQGAPFNIKDFKVLLDKQVYEGLEGRWVDLFNRMKWDIIKSVLKSVAGLQGRKFKVSLQITIINEREKRNRIKGRKVFASRRGLLEALDRPMASQPMASRPLKGVYLGGGKSLQNSSSSLIAVNGSLCCHKSNCCLCITATLKHTEALQGPSSRSACRRKKRKLLAGTLALQQLQPDHCRWLTMLLCVSALLHHCHTEWCNTCFCISLTELRFYVHRYEC